MITSSRAEIVALRSPPSIKTSHQQIITWNQCCETSLGVCPFILNRQTHSFGLPLRRWNNGTCPGTSKTILTGSARADRPARRSYHSSPTTVCAVALKIGLNHARSS